MISLNAITIQVGADCLFENTSWCLASTQPWAIMGPTGSGKSILAKAIARQVRLAKGEIQYYFDPEHPGQGRSYLKPNEVLILSAETHQNFLKRYVEYHQARWQSMEGEDVPTLGGLLSAQMGGVLGEQTHAVVHLLGLEPLLERKILQLSNGESRKAYIAWLLLRGPQLLILDDPYVGLDRESRIVLQGCIEELIRQGHPQVLFVGSRLEEVPAGVEHILWVQDRQVVSAGSREADRDDLHHRSTHRSIPATLSPALQSCLEDYAHSLNDHPASRLSDLICMEHVSVQYGDLKILKDINWRVKPGERWALLGPNGAGKTTLLSLILADHPQGYTHHLALFGRKRGTGETIWDIKKNIGWVSPELQIHYPRLIPCQDVVGSGFYDSVGLYRQPTTAQRQIALRWLAALGLEKLAGQSFHTLSTGEQRLALLARSLVKHPLLLLFDEPCQGLDDEYRGRFIQFLEHLCDQTPVSMIYVTHSPEEIPQAVTHRLILEQGVAQEMD